MNHAQRGFAELIGTFWLVFGGCGSAVLAAAFPDVGIGLVGVSLAFGLTVLTMAYSIGCRIEEAPADRRRSAFLSFPPGGRERAKSPRPHSPGWRNPSAVS